MSAPSDDEWPEGLTEDGDELFLQDKLLVPENRMEELIDHWHNAQLMHPGRDKMQQDLEWRFKFPPGYYAILDKYCSDCAVCRATKSPYHSTACNRVYTAIPEAPMRSVAMDVFAMPEVTTDAETYDCVILAVDRHSGYILAVPGKKSKKKDKKDKHRVGLQAKTFANAMIRHWLTIFDVPAVICSDRGSQFVGTWFKAMCKHMGIRHAKTVAYHSRSNGWAEVAGQQMFEKFRQLHIDEQGRNWYNSLWRVLQAYHDLPGPTGLSCHRILFLRDRVSRTLTWLNHGKGARDANAMMAEADDTAAKVCKALQDEHEKRAKYFKRGKVQKYALQDTVWVERHHKPGQAVPLDRVHHMAMGPRLPNTDKPRHLLARHGAREPRPADPNAPGPDRAQLHLTTKHTAQLPTTLAGEKHFIAEGLADDIIILPANTLAATTDVWDDASGHPTARKDRVQDTEDTLTTDLVNHLVNRSSPPEQHNR